MVPVTPPTETVLVGRDELDALRDVWRAARLLAGINEVGHALRSGSEYSRERVRAIHEALDRLAPIDDDIALGRRIRIRGTDGARLVGPGVKR